jgi:hypothetical protein
MNKNVRYEENIIEFSFFRTVFACYFYAQTTSEADAAKLEAKKKRKKKKLLSQNHTMKLKMQKLKSQN